MGKRLELHTLQGAAGQASPPACGRGPCTEQTEAGRPTVCRPGNLGTLRIAQLDLCLP